MADLREWDVTVTMVRTVDGRKETRDFTVRVPAAGTSGAETAAHGIGYAINEGSRYGWKFASDEAVRVQRVDGCVSGRRADGAPLRPPVMAEGATWPSGTVAPFPAAWFNIVAAAIVGAIPPDDACLADEEECFERHPVHLGWSVDGTARTVYAKIDGLIEVVLAAVMPLIRAQVADERLVWHLVESVEPA